MQTSFKIIFSFLLILLPYLNTAQESTTIIERTFPETRLVNGHSVETNSEGVLKFIIAHRFAAINAGIYDFFGFDDANMRIGFDYGVRDWFTIGIGRSSLNKTYDAYGKFKLIRQKSGSKSFPVTLTWFTGASIETIRDNNPDYDLEMRHRLFYTNQLLMARKFSENFSLQVMPTIVHRNLVQTAAEENTVFAFGIAPKILISKRVSLNVEYYHVLDNQLAEGFTQSLGIGLDIETKGHVFQLNFGNSRGLIEKAFITETTDNWLDGEIHFGFNITRDFKLKGRPYRKYSKE